LLHGKKVLIVDKILLLHGGAVPKNDGAALLKGKIVLMSNRNVLLLSRTLAINDEAIA